jgi:hypothetical protein
MQKNPNKSRFLPAQGLIGLSGLLILAGTACTSKPNSETPKAPPTSNLSADHFDGGTYCVQAFLQGPAPSQPLHFSNSVVESDPTLKTKDFQADYAGDNVDLVRKDKWLATDEDRQSLQDTRKFDDPKVLVRTINGDTEEDTITNHATRSDQVSWRGVVMGISQGGTPWSLFLNKPQVSRAGTENVNGFDTIKYTVDTTHQSQPDKMALVMFGKLQDYNITGTAWVLKDVNCVLQYNIDYQQTTKDGKVSKTHYEGTVTKK